MKKKILLMTIICMLSIGINNVFAWSEFFTDDFSTEDLGKWELTEGSKIEYKNGGMHLLDHNHYAMPKNADPSENISIEFDVSGFVSGKDFYANFKCPVDNNSFKVHFKSADGYVYTELTGFLTGMPNGDNIWKIFASWKAPADGNCSIKAEIADGNLNVYTKENGNYVKKGTLKSADSQGLIEPLKAYIAGFYAFNNQDITIDNVVLKSLAPFKPVIADTLIDARIGTEIKISFENAPVKADNTNIYLTKEDGTVVSSDLKQTGRGEYALVLKDWLTEGEKVSVNFKDLTSEFGQKIDSLVENLTVKTYNNDFTICDLLKINEDIKEPLNKLETGTFTVAASLAGNRPDALKADIALMVCKGTKDSYRISDIYYWNQADINTEKTAEITVKDGEFIKVMAFDNYEGGKAVAESMELLPSEKK